METILVTGGAGFIGSNTVLELVSQGYDVKVLDNLKTGRLMNLSAVRDEIEFVRGDIRDSKILKKSFNNVDYILHEAAIPSVSRSVNDPITSNDVNVYGTLNILNIARKSNVKRVVYASSSSVYGDTKILPKTEDMAVSPMSPYSVSKIASEYYCRVFYKVYGLETISLRYFNVFGPRQDPTSEYAAAIPKFIALMLSGKKPTIYGDGLQSRDFTFVDNVVQANILALKSKKGVGDVFNIGCGVKTTVSELVSEIGNALNIPVKPLYTAPRRGDIRHSVADISTAKKILSYKPRYNLVEGLTKTVEWFLHKK